MTTFISHSTKDRMGTEKKEQMIVFFDGHCHLCSSTVLWLIARDPQKKLQFASLQGETAKSLLSKDHVQTLASIVFFENGTISEESSAALNIAQHLRQPWPLAALVMKVIPLQIRNFVYRYIATHRYSWFGRADVCYRPLPENRDRFLI